MKATRAWKWGAIALLFATTALAQGKKQPETVTKEVTGEAAIVAGNKDKARRDAKNAALREAVEQVAGVMISADTLTQNSQLVSDRVFANSAGYVKSYDIVKEEAAGGVLRMTVRAQVGTAELDKDLQAVKALIARMGNKRLLIVLQEQTVTLDKTIVSSGVMGQVLAETFGQDGWRLIDPSFAAGKLEVASGVSLTTPDKKVIQSLDKADYILSGTVTFRHETMSVGGNVGVAPKDGLFPVVGEWEMGVFATDSGTQIAKLSGKFNSGPKDLGPKGTLVVSYERTAFDIAKHRGKDVVGEVRKAVVDYLSKAEQNGNAVVTTVLGLSDYGSVMAFKRTLTEGVQGVREVQQGTFAAGKAQFDVSFLGTTQDFAERVDGKKFKGRAINVTGISGNTIELTLAK